MTFSLAAFVWLSTAGGLIFGLLLWLAAFSERSPGAALAGVIFLLYAAWGIKLIVGGS